MTQDGPSTHYPLSSGSGSIQVMKCFHLKLLICHDGLNSAKGIHWIKRKAEQYCLH